MIRSSSMLARAASARRRPISSVSRPLAAASSGASKPVARTVAALGSMPYLRDKFQGVLLRSRQQQGDKPKRLDAYEPYVWTGGVLGVAIARAKGKLRGKKPKLSDRQQQELRRMYDTGEYSISDLAEVFSISRPTVYRTLGRQAAEPVAS